MIGRTLSININGVGTIKGVLIRDTKEFMIIRGEDGSVTSVVKKWITMFRVADAKPRPTVYVYGIKDNKGEDTHVRFFRVGEKSESDGKTLLGAVDVKGKVFLLGEISELDDEELKASLDGTITGDA